MKTAVFSTKPYEQRWFTKINKDYSHDLVFFDFRLTPKTVSLANNFEALCVFIYDDLGAETLKEIASNDTYLIALRCSGFNNVNLEAAKELGIRIVRVPAYSPYAVAEHAVGLILMLNRKLYRSYNRVRDDNFSLNGLLGFDLHGQTVGVIGTGRIGQCFAQIMHGFGCHLLAYDIRENPACHELGVRYVKLQDLLEQSDIVSLHCPLLPATQHLINKESLKYMKLGTMLINTSRGGLIDTQAVISALKSGQLGYLGIDVYEDEADLFYQDLSDTLIQDSVFQLLQSFPNVVITAHQAFFTQEAMKNIAETTLSNIMQVEAGKSCVNELNL